jgi:pyrophosphate--fructose-6-phosphate 1-phosphotransferase
MPEIGLSPERKDVHGIFIPEMQIDIQAEAKRLRALMDQQDNVNIFISEGAGVSSILKEMEAAGESVPRDAFGHVKLDAVNPGKWFGEKFAELIGAEKVLVQKSGYFARAAAANADDIRLIKSCTDLAVDCAVVGESGVIGHDEADGNRLKAIEFPRIAGGKAFDIDAPWFEELLAAIGQPKGAAVMESAHP